jgi:RNA polymerase sigma factor (sigma-70 family)
VNTPARLDAVFEANRAALERFLRARLGNAADGEDVLQDLWLKVSRLDAGLIAEPLSYLYKMAENLAFDRRRSTARRANRDANWTKGQVDCFGGAAIDTQPSAERILLAREHLQRVNAAIDGLPERTAFAFRAARIDGVAQKQIAAQMGISLSAVEKHLQRGYRAIVDLQHRIDAEQESPQRLHLRGKDDGDG